MLVEISRIIQCQRFLRNRGNLIRKIKQIKIRMYFILTFAANGNICLKNEALFMSGTGKSLKQPLGKWANSCVLQHDNGSREAIQSIEE